MYQVRWMIRRDLAQVLQIERELFGKDAWDLDGFVSRTNKKNTIGRCAFIGDTDVVAGYVVYDIKPTELNVTTLCVSPKWQRRGVGSSLVDSLKSKLNPTRRDAITGIVHEAHTHAHLFLRSQRFKATKVHKRKFVDGSDGYQFRYDFDEPDCERAFERMHPAAAIRRRSRSK